jgi:ABC-type phosphate transport system substrate-binding protein
VKSIIPLLLGAALLTGGAAAQAADPEVIVVIANPSAPTLTKEQIADLFLGKNQGMKLLDQPNSAPVKAVFYQKVSGHDLSQVKATWARLIFTGKAQAPKEVTDAAAVKKAVASDPKAIGYIEKSELDPSVKVLLLLN